MSTQIFINPNQCKPEFTKIVGHAFGFSPDVLMSDGFYYGGTPTGVGGQLWSAHRYELTETEPQLLDQGTFIPIPINLVSDDVITITGSAAFNNAQAWQNAGWNVNLVVGVFYLNCSEIGSGPLQYFTFVPIETFNFNRNGVACFSIDTTLTSNFDRHETKLIMVYNVFAECADGPDNCPTPATPEPFVTVSHTMDIERPCAVITSESNFIIRNCCEPIITELVNIPGLTVGSFHVDDEGNCWEVVSASNDVTNFTRNFVDIYTSCVACQSVNPCPQNLIIQSCCVLGEEFVTGSLPGLEVGDTFVDNNGLCWYVSSETGGPVSEESITVVTIIPGGCEDCTLANPCPSFWEVLSCCGNLRETIATSVSLNMGDSFVDTNGICWRVGKQGQELPTNYDIVVDTVYTGGLPDENCTDCTTANPCPTEYFITVRACCDNDRVEVVSVPSQYMSFYEGSIFSDPYNLCWEVMSYSTTGVETYPINWSSFFASTYGTCKECTTRFCKKGEPCPCLTLWQVQLCGTSTTYIAYADGVLDVGSIYQGQNYMSTATECFEVLGYGYPDTGLIQVQIDPDQISYATCEECQTPPPSNFREVTLCCSGQTIVVNFGTYVLPFPPAPAYVYDLTHNFDPGLSGNYCCTVGNQVFNVLTPWEYNNVITAFGNCSACTMMYPNCPS
jgi:hypothetical protein